MFSGDGDFPETRAPIPNHSPRQATFLRIWFCPSGLPNLLKSIPRCKSPGIENSHEIRARLLEDHQ